MVDVTSQPPGLAISIDGKDTGQVTPAAITGLYPGDKRVVLRREDGSIVHRFRLALGEGVTEQVSVEEARLPSLLDVTSTPPGAEVRVDGRLKGATPVTVAGLAAGQVKVEGVKEGCEPKEEQVSLRKATVVPLSVRLRCGAP